MTRVNERGLTSLVRPCLPNLRLNPDAFGGSRHPLHDTDRNPVHTE